MKKITILLVDDTRYVRRLMKKLLAAETDLEVVGEAENGVQAVALAKQLRPTLVLMDVTMPLANGFEATREITRSVPETRVLMLTSHDEEAYVAEAVKSGAKGYLVKQSCAGHICMAIREVFKGNSFFSPGPSR